MAGSSVPASAPLSGDPAWLHHLLLCLRKALGHDLSNQLIGVQGLLRLLESEEGHLLHSNGREYLHLLQDGVKRTQERVRLLSHLARLGSASSVFLPVPLDEVAREAIASVQMLYPNRGIRYRDADQLPDLPVTRTDLRNVLTQLFRNAVEATEECQTPEIELVGGESAEQWWFRIKDQGRGFRADDLTRLRHFLSSREDQGFRGGLGLLLVRETVSTWLGRLHVESDAGKGCMVTCTIPRIRDVRVP